MCYAVGPCCLSIPYIMLTSANPKRRTWSLPSSLLVGNYRSVLSVLKTTEIYCLPVLEAASPQSRCWQGCALPEVCRGESFLPATGVCQPSLGSLASSCSIVVSVSDTTWPLSLVCLNFFCSHEDINHIGFKVTLLQCGLILAWLHLQRPCFQIRSVHTYQV